MVAAFFPFMPYPLVGIGSLGAGYCDFPLAVFYLAAALALLRNDFRLAGLLAGALPWLKRDGIALWASIALFGLLMLITSRWNWKRAAYLILPGLIVAGLWRVWMNHVGAGGYSDLLPVTPATLIAHSYRFAALLWQTLLELASVMHWSVLWFGFAGVCLWRMVSGLSASPAEGTGRDLPDCRLAIGLVVLPLTADAALFIFSSWPAYVYHFRAAFPRLVLHVVPLAWAVTVGLAAALSSPRSQTRPEACR